VRHFNKHTSVGVAVAVAAAHLGVGGLLLHRASGSPQPAKEAAVTLQKLPNGGIQPQAAIDSNGTVHVVYFTGKPEAGDLYYFSYPVNAGPLAASRLLRVNSQPQTAMAAGTIRSEQIAIGQDNRVHVVWNGLGAKEGKAYAPMYMAYARLNDAGTAFEQQRNLCQWTGNLDGGGSVAADNSGNVYATWHTGPPNSKGEGERGVFVAVSSDNGKTFGRERMVNPDPTGACACCSMRAFVEKDGTLRILYRAAMEDGTQRDTMLLTSRDKGKTYAMKSLDPWPLNACPMSSMSLAQEGSTLLAAWETREQVFWAPMTSDGRPLRPGIAAPGTPKSKHPVIAANGKGNVLFAWTEGTGWQKGGSLSWQVYDVSGRPVGPRGHEESGVPTWSLLSAYAKPDGSFVLLH
jgi:hypothetical protein